jgi:CubicO group peptidase (beta-lactamase class C family)
MRSDSPHLPQQEWDQADPDFQSLDADALERSSRFIAEQRPACRSLLVFRSGFLVFERYFNGASAADKQPIASVTKTVIGTLIGMLMENRLFRSPDQRLVEIFPELKPIYANSAREHLTLAHLLSMTDGWKFNEDDPSEPVQSSPTPAKFMLENYPLAHEPGTHFNYNTISTQILSHAIKRVTGQNAFDCAKATLFRDLAIDDVDWPINREGDALGGGGIRIRPRDLAKIGLLYLHGGTWSVANNTRRLVSANFIEAATTAHSNGGLPIGLPYGYCLWLGELGGRRAWMGLGFGGQRLAMLPDADMIIVVTNRTDQGLRGLDGNDLSPMVREWIR